MIYKKYRSKPLLRQLIVHHRPRCVTGSNGICHGTEVSRIVTASEDARLTRFLKHIDLDVAALVYCTTQFFGQIGVLYKRYCSINGIVFRPATVRENYPPDVPLRVLEGRDCRLFYGDVIAAQFFALLFRKFRLTGGEDGEVVGQIIDQSCRMYGAVAVSENGGFLSFKFKTVAVRAVNRRDTPTRREALDVRHNIFDARRKNQFFGG